MQWHKGNSKQLCIKETGLNHLFHRTGVTKSDNYLFHKGKGKGKAVPLQAWSGPEGSRKLRFPDL